MDNASGACVIVGKGGVGESGSSSLVTHTAGGPTSKILIVRTVASSLCPNTGAIAVLVVDGIPKASDQISGVGSTIQTEVTPGSRVAAIVHAVPLFNGIVCVRLGELEYTLSECDLVSAQGLVSPQGLDAGKGGVLPVPGPNTRDWYAWNNLMPPRPDDFHIIGEVETSNLGVDVQLVPKNPQGINRRILLIDLVLVQKPGFWPQIVTWKQARYDKVNATYDGVQIFFDNQQIASIPVDNIL